MNHIQLTDNDNQMKMQKKHKLIVLMLVAAGALLNTNCGSKTVVYNPHTGMYAKGKEAERIIDQQEDIREAREQSRDRELDRNLKRRDSSRYVTRESVVFGQTIDEFDVLAARDRALQAEADVARTQAENAEAVSRSHKIIDYEKRYERAMTKLDKLEVLPGTIKD